MNESKQRRRLLWAVWQGFGLMVAVGIIIAIIFRWGDVWPFLAALFRFENMGMDLLIGLGSGLLMAGLVTGAMKVTKMELPENEMTKMLVEVIHTRGGIFTISIGAAVAEEFLFRGVLIGLFLDVWPAPLVILLNAFLFMALHIPQYKGQPLMHLIVLVMGVWLALLFVMNGTLWAPVAAHAVYNGFLAIQMRSGKRKSVGERSHG